VHACTAYAEAGQPLKEEQPLQAAQADEEAGAGEPMWEPPSHVLDSDDEAGELGEEEEAEDEEELGAAADDMDEEEEELPVVARPNPPKRKAAAEPRLKKLHKHSAKKRGTDKRAS
jgi:hypothetical protein